MRPVKPDEAITEPGRAGKQRAYPEARPISQYGRKRKTFPAISKSRRGRGDPIPVDESALTQLRDQDSFAVIEQIALTLDCLEAAKQLHEIETAARVFAPVDRRAQSSRTRVDVTL
jgi:hypothetical protein